MTMDIARIVKALSLKGRSDKMRTQTAVRVGEKVGSAGIAVPAKDRYLLEEDGPSPEYKEAIVRDFFKDLNGQLFDRQRRAELMGLLGVTKDWQINYYTQKLARAGWLTSKKVIISTKPIRWCPAYIYNPVPIPYIPKPRRYRGAEGSEVIVTKPRKNIPDRPRPKRLPSLSDSIAEAIRNLVIQKGDARISYADFSKATGLHAPSSIHDRLKPLLESGKLSRKALGDGKRAGFSYTWHDAPAQVSNAPSKTTLAPADEDRISLSATPSIHRPVKPMVPDVDLPPQEEPLSYTKENIRDAFIEWLDEHEQDDKKASIKQAFLEGANSFRRFVERKIDY